MKVYKYNLIMLAIIFISFIPFMLFGQEDRLPEPEVDWGFQAIPFEQAGMSSWQFLKIPSTARSLAIGGITTATSHGDAGSALTNPASMPDVEDWDLSLNTMNWIADISYHSGALVKNLGKWGVIGFHFIYVDVGEMIRTENLEIFDAGGNTLGIQPVTEGLGTFTAGDLSLGLSYARQITDRLQVGGTLRYVQETLDDATAANWALDIGTMYYTGIKSLRISMLGRNFGPDVEFTDYREEIGVPPVPMKMPMAFLFGAAIDILEGKGDNPHLLTLVAEFVHPNDGPEKLNFGTEYSFMKFAMIRAGYRHNYDEQGLTFGGGLSVATSSFNVCLNYSYMSFGRLSNVNMLSVGLGF